jgi:CBS domain containing-hemolysin-like protein
VAFIFVALNGFFVASEFALVKLRFTRVHVLKDSKGWRGTILAKIHGRLDEYLSACQLGITLSSLGLGWVGEPAFADLFAPVLAHLGISSLQAATFISLAIAFFIISFLHIVVGELMPKSMAIRQCEKISLWTALPLYGFYWAMYPLIYLLNKSASFLLKLFRLDSMDHGESSYTSEEIKLILKSSHLHGELEKSEAEMIGHALDFADLKVRHVMCPIENLIALDSSQPLSKNLKIIIDHRYSRYPVYKGDLHNILGIIHAKDYLAIQHEKTHHFSLKDILRPPIKISPHSSTLKLLERFKKGSTHMALVYQGKNLVGFLTLDNLLQHILGRIQDEFHRSRGK